MPWLVFERDFLWCPEVYTRHVAVAFKKGNIFFATRDAAAQALDRKAAREATEEEVKNARRGA